MTRRAGWRLLPFRGFGESAVLTVLFTGALWLERVPWPALLLLPPLALSAGFAAALRHRDTRARRPAVALARVTTCWTLLICLPGAAALAETAGAPLVLLGPAALVLAPVGTLLLRQQHDVAGIVFKLLALLPPAVGLFLTRWSWLPLLGAAAFLLTAALLATTLHAHHADPRPTFPTGGEA